MLVRVRHGSRFGARYRCVSIAGYDRRASAYSKSNESLRLGPWPTILPGFALKVPGSLMCSSVMEAPDKDNVLCTSAACRSLCASPLGSNRHPPWRQTRCGVLNEWLQIGRRWPKPCGLCKSRSMFCPVP